MQPCRVQERVLSKNTASVLKINNNKKDIRAQGIRFKVEGKIEDPENEDPENEVGVFTILLRVLRSTSNFCEYTIAGN